MKKVSISRLKARLSEYLGIVRRGEHILVTDRGKPVASLGPVSVHQSKSDRVNELIRAGRIRPPRAALPATFWKEKAPPDPTGAGLKALLEERAEGR